MFTLFMATASRSAFGMAIRIVGSRALICNFAGCSRNRLSMHITMLFSVAIYSVSSFSFL